jgi:transformer-2 protein
MSSRSRERSRTPKKKSRRRSRSRSRSERRSKRSRSPRSRDRSQSRDRSRERRDRSRGRGRDSSRDRRPTKSYNESRNEESNTLAIFNLYYKTDQDELRRIFERYGKIEKCNIVNNRRRGQTTAFGFLTFENLDDAREAKEDAHGMEIDGNIIRTDYCLSKGGHDPTPGRYLGKRREFYRSPSREKRRAKYRDRSRGSRSGSRDRRRSRSRGDRYR